MTSIDRQAAYTGTKDVSAPLRFDTTRLEAYLAANARGFEGPLSVKQFRGGQSNPTYYLETPSRKYVLRRKPPGKLLPSAHAVDREFKVINALYKQGFPVAEPVVYCADESVTGTAFYVMGFVAGRVIWVPEMPDSNPQERTAVFDAMNATLARLHSYEPSAIGLSDYGKGENYVARQVDRWSKQYRASETEKIDEMERIMEWLPAHLPPPAPVRLVHGDYRLDNMILHQTEPKVLAVLDWELSTLGHPLADFSYHCMSWHIAPSPSHGARGIGGLDLAALGIPSEKEYVRRYCERTGRADPDAVMADWSFYMAYNLFRMAGILQGIAKRVEAGTASSAQARQSAAGARPLAEMGWRIAKHGAPGV
jgi:aminoglycoside phosphotransferase (APT) family kinase protein